MKNSLVIYDSVFGNTEKIAQAMANAKSDGEIIWLCRGKNCQSVKEIRGNRGNISRGILC